LKLTFAAWEEAALACGEKLCEMDDTVFQKMLAVSDYFFGSEDWKYPLDLIQMCATSHGAQIRGEAHPNWLEWVPKMPFEEMARRVADKLKLRLRA
jgi:hypothetical protein